jgi:hypothetical protein
MRNHQGRHKKPTSTLLLLHAKSAPPGRNETEHGRTTETHGVDVLDVARDSETRGSEVIDTAPREDQ